MKRAASRKSWRWIGIAAAWALATAGCDVFETRVAGGGSEAGSAIVAGRLTDASGRPMEGVLVRAFGEEADPLLDSALSPCRPIYSDSAGEYRLACRESGPIRITGIHPERRVAFLVSGIRPSAKQKVRVPDVVLRAPGRLRVPLPDSGATVGSYVYLAGTPYFQRVDSAALADGAVVLDPVPSGVLPSVRLASPGDSAYLTLAASATVTSAQTTHLYPYAAWARSRSFRLDPSSAGPLGGDLIGFPLLVRLSAAELDFAQARADGSDLRFAKADGTPLPFSIESWDAASSRAAVWVRMDTIFADAREQAMTMFWGNPEAHAPSTRRPIFDTAAGFAGVWHLSEDMDSSGTAGVYRDATPDGTDGDDYITTPANSGAIGGGLNLQGRMWVEMRTVPQRMQPAQALTLSAWVKADALGDSAISFARLEDGYTLAIRPDSTIRFSFSNGLDTPTVVTGKFPIRDGVWHNVAAVFDGASARIYLDGKMAVQATATGPIKYVKNPYRRFFMGNWSQEVPGFNDFRGGLDEVQLSRVARGAGWNALAFATQRPEAGLLIWSP